MTPEHKQALKQAILQKIDLLKRQIETYGDLSRPVSPDNALGRLTRMEAINSRSINEASLLKSKLSLKSLEKQLDAIETPDFGLCRHCEDPIPHKRLMVMPEASLCVGCAENLTRGQD